MENLCLLLHLLLNGSWSELMKFIFLASQLLNPGDHIYVGTNKLKLNIIVEITIFLINLLILIGPYKRLQIP